MQSLWSRAGQAHQCGCRACGQAVSRAGRRADISARRRKPTFAEIFTACYSSVLASAAIVDAIRKEDRRNDLDRQLEAARLELKTVRDRALPSPKPKSEDLNTQQMTGVWQSLKTVVKNQPLTKEIHMPPNLSASALLARVKHRHYDCDYANADLRWDRNRQRKLRKAILAEDGNRQIPARHAQNLKQLQHQARNIRWLMHQLMKRADPSVRHTHDGIDPKEATAAPEAPFGQAVFKDVQDLLEQDYPKYKLCSIDPEGARRSTVVFNRQLRKIMNTRELNAAEKVARVCYNLLVAPYAPDISTYNTLIVEFDAKGRSNLAEAVCNSFFYFTFLRPTPTTYSAILNHYQQTRNAGEFMRTLARITGLDELTGGKVTRRHIDEVVANPAQMAWAGEDHMRTVKGQWVTEHAPVDVTTVEMMISGLTFFRLFEEAARLFVCCVIGRIKVSASVIREMLDECVTALDRRGAVQLLRGLALFTPWHNSLLMTYDYKTYCYIIGRLRVLLDMCGCDVLGIRRATIAVANSFKLSPQKLGDFRNAVRKADLGVSSSRSQGTANPFTEFQTRLGGPESRLLRIESLLKEVRRVRNTTYYIKDGFLQKSKYSPTLCRSITLYLVEDAKNLSRQLNREFIDHFEARPESFLRAEELEELLLTSNPRGTRACRNEDHEDLKTEQLGDLLPPVHKDIHHRTEHILQACREFEQEMRASTDRVIEISATPTAVALPLHRTHQREAVPWTPSKITLLDSKRAPRRTVVLSSPDHQSFDLGLETVLSA